MSLEPGIWASRLESGPRDWDLRGGTKEEKEEKEKIPLPKKGEILEMVEDGEGDELELKE